jgi:hypothetical protein
VKDVCTAGLEAARWALVGALLAIGVLSMVVGLALVLLGLFLLAWLIRRGRFAHAWALPVGAGGAWGLVPRALGLRHAGVRPLAGSRVRQRRLLFPGNPRAREPGVGLVVMGLVWGFARPYTTGSRDRPRSASQKRGSSRCSLEDTDLAFRKQWRHFRR